MDISLTEWLELKYGAPELAPKSDIRRIVTSWLSHSFKEQFDEFMEIQKRMVSNTSFDVNYDPDDEHFSDWLASKFNNHKTMDRATKNALWIYWMRWEDEEVLTNEELLSEELYVDSTFNNGVEELFSIDIDVFNYETQ